MKNNTRKAISFCVLAITLPILTMSCTFTKYPDYKVPPLAQHYLAQNKENLFVAIEPFYDKGKTKDYFGVDLLSHNILPIFVAVENHNSSSSFMLLKEKFSISKPDNRKHTDTSGSQSISSAYSSTVKTGNVLVSSGLIVAPLILIGVGSKMQADGSAVKYNLITKELQSESIPPNKSQQGFVYFQLKNSEDIEAISIFELKALNLKTGEVVTFKFNMK